MTSFWSKCTRFKLKLFAVLTLVSSFKLFLKSAISVAVLWLDKNHHCIEPWDVDLPIILKVHFGLYLWSAYDLVKREYIKFFFCTPRGKLSLLKLLISCREFILNLLLAPLIVSYNVLRNWSYRLHESKQTFSLYFEDKDSNFVNELIPQNLIKIEPCPNSFTKTLPLNQNLLI